MRDQATDSQIADAFHAVLAEFASDRDEVPEDEQLERKRFWIEWGVSGPGTDQCLHEAWGGPASKAICSRFSISSSGTSWNGGI
jgi:hypothetical protein